MKNATASVECQRRRAQSWCNKRVMTGDLFAYALRSLTSVEQRYVEVEKEALGLTWVCERFRDCLIGQHFVMETGHKPLLSLLGGQELDALPPCIQRVLS